MQLFGFEVPGTVKYPIKVMVFNASEGKPYITWDWARVKEIAAREKALVLKVRKKTLLNLDWQKYAYPGNLGRTLILYTYDGEIYAPMAMNEYTTDEKNNTAVLDLKNTSNMVLQSHANKWALENYMPTTQKTIIIAAVFIFVAVLACGIFWKLATDNLGDVAGMTNQIAASLENVARNFNATCEAQPTPPPY